MGITQLEAVPDPSLEIMGGGGRSSRPLHNGRGRRRRTGKYSYIFSSFSLPNSLTHNRVKDLPFFAALLKIIIKMSLIDKTLLSLTFEVSHENFNG